MELYSMVVYLRTINQSIILIDNKIKQRDKYTNIQS